MSAPGMFYSVCCSNSSCDVAAMAFFSFLGFLGAGEAAPRGRFFRRYTPLARVWGRHPDELALIVVDPLEQGVFRPRSQSEIPGSPTVGASCASESPKSVPQLAPRVVVLRPALGRDHYAINEVRMSDRAWLAPWEPSVPPQSQHSPPSISEYARLIDRMSREGEALAMVLELDGRVVGLVNVSGVMRGALHGCTIGYWVHSSAAGHGLGSWAVAATIDLLIGELDMHRVEINIRPENKPSLALARKLNLREEGYKPRYLHIGGKWADHYQFAIDSESLPEFGLVHSLLNDS